jgi:hypothetical protein
VLNRIAKFPAPPCNPPRLNPSLAACSGAPVHTNPLIAYVLGAVVNTNPVAASLTPVFPANGTPNSVTAGEFAAEFPKFQPRLVAFR